MANMGMKVFLGVALAIVLIALVNLGVNVFYPEPQYNTYCNNTNYNIQDASTCVGVGGQWNPTTTPKTADAPIGYCDPDYTCRQTYEAEQKAYTNVLFYILIGLGLILAIVGLFLVNLTFSIIGIGAGIALIIEGIIRNFANKQATFIAGVIVFAVLSFLVYRKFKD